MGESEVYAGPIDDLRPGERYRLAVLVGDATPLVPVEEAAHDLNHRAHEVAAARWGPTRDCRWSYFSRGESEYGREEFLDEMRTAGGSEAQIEASLRQWDESSRPIAVCHISIVDPRRERARWN